MKIGEDKFYFKIRNNLTNRVLLQESGAPFVFEYEKQAQNYIERNNLSKKIYKIETFKKRAK